MKKEFLTNKNLLSGVHAWVKECLTQQTTEDQFLTIIIVVNEIIQNIYRYTYHLENWHENMYHIKLDVEEMMILE